MVLDVWQGSTADGAAIVQWNWHGGDNQRFALDEVANGYFGIRAKHSGKVLDVTRASKQDGARIIQWGWHGGDNQLWQRRVIIDRPE